MLSVFIPDLPIQDYSLHSLRAGGASANVMPECLKDCLKDMVVGNQTRQKFNHCCQFHCHKYLIFHFSHSFSLHTALVDTPQLWLLILYSFERGSKLEYK